MKSFAIPLLFISLLSSAQENVQTFSEISLLKMLKTQKAESGLVIVKELSTGKEIASIGYSSRKDKNGLVVYKKDTNLVNTYMEPGALIMPISAAILMDQFGVTLQDTVDLEGGETVIYGIKVLDSEKHGEGKVNLNTVLSMSSNVGMAKLMSKHILLGSDLFKNQLERYLQTNLLKLPNFESQRTIAYAAFGYGLMLTPNELLTFYERVSKNDASLFNNPSTLAQTQKALLNVTKEGTAQWLMKNSKVDMGIKTATTLALGKNGYLTKQYYAAMAGYAPFVNPKYACIVVIKCKPKAAEYYSAEVAGPVFKQIMEKLSHQIIQFQNKNLLNE